MNANLPLSSVMAVRPRISEPPSETRTFRAGCPESATVTVPDTVAVPTGIASVGRVSRAVCTGVGGGPCGRAVSSAPSARHSAADNNVAGAEIFHHRVLRRPAPQTRLATRIAASPDILYLMTTAIGRAFLALVPRRWRSRWARRTRLPSSRMPRPPCSDPASSWLPSTSWRSRPDGAPIIDLKPEEVTLRVDGRTRLLRSLQWIQVAGTGLQAADWVPPPFGSNTASDAGRGIIIVLDNESLNTGREAPLRSAVRRFLSALTPRDRVALVTMPYGGVRVDFTNEHDKVTHGARDDRGTGLAHRNWVRRRVPHTPHARIARRPPRRARSARGPTTMMFFTTGLSGPRRDAPLTLAPGAMRADGGAVPAGRLRGDWRARAVLCDSTGGSGAQARPAADREHRRGRVSRAPTTSSRGSSISAA